MSLGDRILQLLSELNITQKYFALELDIATSTLNGYIKNYRQPDYETLCKIAGYFEVTTDYLLGMTNYKNLAQACKETVCLTPDERALLVAFRSTDQKGRVILLDLAKYCLSDDGEC